VADADEATALMRRLRHSPPSRLAGFASTTTDLLQRPGPDRTDALIFTGGDADTSARVVVRPSGTEPKVKCYIEVRSAATAHLATARRRATALCDELASSVRHW
jgi:phosphomannomutase